MRWVEKFLDRLEEALETLGTISWRFDEDENSLRVAPSMLEVVGGADDGETVYPFFSLNVSHMIEVFDEPPEMLWNTMNNEFWLEGMIEGDEAWIILSREPFHDEKPRDVLDPKGGIRKKNRPKD